MWQKIAASLLGVLIFLWQFPGISLAQRQHTHQHAHSGSSELPPGAFTKTSLYQLESTWTTAFEQQIQLGDLHGKARVMVMHYTSCEYACPILISQVKTIANALPHEVKDRVGFVTVTFDPERDPPKVLKAFSEKMSLEPPSWTLLHGAPDDVLELAVLLGVKYKKDNQGGFSHSNLITVLNKAGEIIHRHVGLHRPIAETIAAITQAAQE